MYKPVLVFLFAILSSPTFSQYPCVDGMADNTYPCDNVDLVRFMSLEQMGGGLGTNDIWGWVSDTGREYALVGKKNGTAFIDITTPTSPVYLGDLPTNTVNSTWRDIKVYGDYAFIVSEAGGHGMQIFDLTQLTSVSSPPVTFEADVVYDGFGSAHNVVINEETGFAYGVGTNTYSGGLHIVDISDPLNPTFVGSFGADGYTHDAQVVVYNGPDPDYQGAEVAFACNENNIAIVNVSDKTDCQLISHAIYDNPGYTHQGWLTEDQKYFLLGDEGDEGGAYNTRTYIFDVQDLDNPVYTGFYESVNASTDHNQYINGNFLYQSNYSSGLRILDVADVENANLYEVAFFDVYPQNNNTNYNGTWSNYCYFPSGIVAVTARETGVHFVRPLLITLQPQFAQLECSDTAIFEIVVHPELLGTFEITVDQLGGDVQVIADSFTAPSTQLVTLTGLGTLSPGPHFFDFVLTSEYGEYRVKSGVEANGVMPVTTQLAAPEDGLLTSDFSPLFEWFLDENSMFYTLELYSDEQLTILEYQEVTEASVVMMPFDLEEGTYYWRVHGMNNCGEGAYSSVYQFTISSVGINSMPQLAYSFFPNPSDGLFHLNTEVAPGWVQVFDLAGKLMWETTLNSEQSLLDLSGLQSGVYTLKTQAGHRIKTVIR